MPILLRSILTASLVTCALVRAQATVVINEFAYDDTSTDDREFVELLNVASFSVDISGWTVSCSDVSGPNPSYVIPNGTILFPGQRWVLGSALVPGVNQVIGTVNLFENDQEAIRLLDTGALVVDAVVYEAATGSWPGAPGEGRPLFGALFSDDTQRTSWSRLRDGWDTNDNVSDFRIMPATPGTSNTLPSVQPWAENFDALVIDNAVPQWSGTFTPPFVVDPTVVSVRNPKAVPASPQGGKAMVCTQSGGAMFMMLDDANDKMWFDGYVYFDRPAPGAPATDLITWSIGARGTTDSLFLAPDPERAGATDLNGDTGLTWTYRATTAGATLWLIDNHSGGRAHILLARIANPTVGWHRLSLNCTDGQTQGVLDGTRYEAPAYETLGSIYIGVRTVQVGGALAMYVDDGKSKLGGAGIVSPGDPACLGNCPVINVTAAAPAVESSVASTGRYAFQVHTNETFTADALCLYSTSYKKSTASSTTVSLYTDLLGQPGTLMTAANGGYQLTGTLMDPTDEHLLGWLGAPTGPPNGPSPGPWTVPANTTFWVVVDLTEKIAVPVAATVAVTNGTASAEIMPYMVWNSTGQVWTNAASQGAWTLRWLCTSQSYSKNSWDAFGCVLGTTIFNNADSADPTTILAIDAIGFNEFPVPVDLAPFGMPSCQFFPNPVSTILALPSGPGIFTQPFAIPNVPALTGLPLISQWIFFDVLGNLDASPKAKVILR